MDCNQGASCNAPVVYGFLCEQTNVFYAFETHEQYQEFLEWLHAETAPQTHPASNAMPTDD
jgi:hypothetical protein